jgi:segregation and condensation protein A
MEDTRAVMNPRAYATAEISHLIASATADAEMEQVSLYKLMKVFERLLARLEDEQKNKRVHTVYNFNYNIQDQKVFLKLQVFNGGRKGFEQLFLNLENRIHAIVTFLALLELLNAQELAVTQGEGYNNFWIHEAATEPPNPALTDL